VDTIHDEGWIKLHRKSMRSQVFQSEGLWKLWSWCLLRANHEDTWIPITTGKGITEVFVKRGQFVFGRKSAAKALKMDESTIYKRMMKLKSMENLNIESNTHYSIVTILNYELYQGSKKGEVTPKVTPKEHPSNTDKNDKNEKKSIGRSKKQTDPRIKEFQTYWGEIFQKEIGQPYTFSFAKEGSLIKNLLTVHDLPTLQKLTKTFFKDEQCKRRGLTIGIFFQEINRLLSLKAMDPLEQAKKDLGWKDP
jgi:hypothetical protein